MAASDSPGLRIARIAPADLGAYKTLRDEALRLHPDAFDADIESEQALLKASLAAWAWVNLWAVRSCWGPGPMATWSA